MEQKDIDLVEAYKYVFGSKTGKKILYDLIRKEGVFDDVFSSDPLKMAYNAGRAAVVKNILSKVDSDVKKMHEYMQKAYDIDS